MRDQMYSLDHVLLNLKEYQVDLYVVAAQIHVNKTLIKLRHTWARLKIVYRCAYFVLLESEFDARMLYVGVWYIDTYMQLKLIL